LKSYGESEKVKSCTERVPAAVWVREPLAAAAPVTPKVKLPLPPAGAEILIVVVPGAVIEAEPEPKDALKPEGRKAGVSVTGPLKLFSDPTLTL
jgi:hypothetical protein